MWVIALAGIIIMSGCAVEMYAVSVRPKHKVSVPKPVKKQKPKTIQPSRGNMEQQRREAQAEVRSTRVKIADNERSLKTALGELDVLNADIAISQGRVNGLNQKVQSLTGRIGTLQKQIDAGERELAYLRSKYLQAVKKMRVAKGRNSWLSFIFSAKSFSEGVRRWRYMRELSRWRERQSRAITTRVALLKTDRQQLALAMTEKRQALAAATAATTALNQQQARKQTVVAELKRNGEQLTGYLAQKQAEVNALTGRISALIAEQERREDEARQRRQEEERRRAAAERHPSPSAGKELSAASEIKPTAQPKPKPKQQPKQKPQPKPQGRQATVIPYKPPHTAATGSDYASARRRKPRTDGVGITPVKPQPQRPQPSTATGFAAARGILPRPVSGGWKVVVPYGRHERAGMKNVVYENTGIDVEAAAGAAVHAVYDGTVSAVYNAPGFGNVVLLKHGEYYTVYANLGSVSVRSGQHVNQGAIVGTVLKSDEGLSTLHFEVWCRRTRLNPSEWIR